MSKRPVVQPVRVKKLLYKGQHFTVSELASLIGLSDATIRARLRAGRSLDEPRGHSVQPKLYQFRGRELSIAQWADLIGIDRDTLRERIVQYAWPLERALTEPVMSMANRFLCNRNRKTIKRIIIAFHTQTGGYEETSPRSLRDRPGSFVPERDNFDTSISKGF